MFLSVRVMPRAPRSIVAGRRGDAVLIRLAAPPVDGAANEALIAFLALTFDVPKRDVRIVSGQTSRDKRIRIDGRPDAEISARLSAILKACPADDSR